MSSLAACAAEEKKREEKRREGFWWLYTYQFQIFKIKLLKTLLTSAEDFSRFVWLKCDFLLKNVFIF
ncbi:hypothetical protein FAH67_00475 [Neisseria flavescens]|uniref:Uncharacterized protein n=1 Tax=Neisseria flavescens NRL30031/H210 TaxID=546264 RepID=C0EM19_NEIFL|nr:hypothetical protein NEIFLAOT_00983 [Neisseria flavescens NRL30031/H210]QCL68064.1 hypothetical protein FAH67_00475 [Neisseria flavescens]